MIKTKIFKIGLLILGVLMISAIGYAGWKINRNSQKVSSESSQPAVKSETATSDWKTYRNEKYKYEISYPKDWDIVSDTTTAARAAQATPYSKIVRIDKSIKGVLYEVQISEVDNPQALSLKKFIETEAEKDKDIPGPCLFCLNTHDIEIDGIHGLATSDILAIDSIIKRLYFAKNTQVFIITIPISIPDKNFDPNIEKYFDYILSSFKFVN